MIRNHPEIDAAGWEQEALTTDDRFDIEENNWHQFAELAHTGMQASLRAKKGRGFIPRNDEIGLTEETANLPYSELPEDIQFKYGKSGDSLYWFLYNMALARSPVDESVVLKGRRVVHYGLMHGSASQNDCRYPPLRRPGRIRQGSDDVCRYIESASPVQQRADENIVNLGFLALKRPLVLPGVRYRFWSRDDVLPAQPTPYGYLDYEHARAQYISSEPGIHEGELRGLAAVNRVVEVTGHATELQASLLEGY